jgi:hypothetical protein
MKAKDLSDKILEMVKDDKDFIEEKIQRAITTGAIDLEEFDDDYRLPKMVLWAIYNELLFQRRPLVKEDRKYAKNICLFM